MHSSIHYDALLASLGIPVLIWLCFWAVVEFGHVSLKPLRPWLIGATFLFYASYLWLDLANGPKLWRILLQTAAFTCWWLAMWLQRRYRFDTMARRGQWRLPWNSVEFSVPQNLHILVRDANSVSPWYVDKLGLRKLAESPAGESHAAAYRFKEDGNTLILTSKAGFETDKTPMLFTRKLDKMSAVLSERGINVRPIERDRQGTRYFQIYDPEGNAIEVVEAP